MSFQSLGRFGLGRALAISAVFHVLLLWPSPTTWREASTAQRLLATLRAPNPPVVPASKIASAQNSATPKPRDVVKPPDAPKPAESTTPLPAIPSDPQARAPNVSTTVGAVRSGAPLLAATAQTSSEGVVDAEGLRGYRLALAREARNHKRYPREAEAAGWNGTVEVRVTVLEGGIPQEPKLLHSSGHAVLDEAALDMMRPALPVTSVPPVLRQRTFSVDIPVVFELPE